jgi:hypothetical protein
VARRRDESAQRVEWWEALRCLGFRDNLSILGEEKRSIAAPQLFHLENVGIAMPYQTFADYIYDRTVIVQCGKQAGRPATKEHINE